MGLMGVWLFSVGAALLGAFGGLLLARGLFGGRFIVRRTRACPRCRYDMSVTEGHTCPECGHVALGEREHYAGGRRWSLALLGAVLLAGGVAIGLGPTVRGSGWVSVLPGAVQARMWDGTNARLHDRLAEALWAGGLSERATGVLRDRVMAVLCDPARTPASLERGVEFFDPPVGVDLFDEADRLELIEHGRAPAVAAAIRRSVRLGVPRTEPMREWRRAQLNGRDYARRGVAFGWLLTSPGDDLDREEVRKRFLAGGIAANWRVTDELEGSEVLLQAALLELLNDEDARVRHHALESARFAGRAMGLMPGPLLDRLKELARDTGNPGWDIALELLADAPFDAGPWLADWMAGETEPEVLHALIQQLGRRRDVTGEVVGVLAGIANNAAWPIGLRLEAGKAHGRLMLTPRMTVEPPGDDATAVYEVLFAGLLTGDPWIEALTRDALGVYPSHSAVMALARAVPGHIADPAGIDAWIGEHPALERAVGRWSIADGPASAKLRTGLRRAAMGPSASPSMTEEGLEYISRWFTRR